MLRSCTCLALFALLAFAGSANAAPASKAFALSGTNLLSFNPATPSSTTSTPITGVGAGETLVGIDIRPQNGMLYALGVNAGADTATLYTVGRDSGVATAVGASGGIAFTTDNVVAVDLPDPATVGYGFDFNPAADRVRVVAGALNFRVNPNTGASVDGDNTGLTTGAQPGTNPDGNSNGGTTTVDSSAYTNSFANNGNVTTLYALDATTDALYRTSSPNAGTQASTASITLSGSPVNFTTVNGFDIDPAVTTSSTNAAVPSGTGYAVLNIGGTTGLYAINLVTGTAINLGNVGNGATAVQGLALQRDFDDAGFPVVALDQTATNLVRFHSATPGTVTQAAVNTAGITAGESLVAVAWRPQTGQLIGLGIDAAANTGGLYVVDPQLGTLARIGGASAVAYVTTLGAPVDLPDPAVAQYGLDINPTVDRVRITTSTGLNARANPTTASGAAVDGDGVSGGTQPDGAQSGFGAGSTGVSMTSYTNAFAQPLSGGTTTQYALDATTNQLHIVNPPNAGTLTAAKAVTSGGAALDFAGFGDFDIPSDVFVGTSATPAEGDALTAFTVGATTGLYTLDLASGAAASVGSIGTGATGIRSIAVADAQRDLPSVSVVDPADVVENGAGVATGQTFGVRLNSPAPSGFSITVATADGTATDADNDYEPVTPTVVSFARGERTKTVGVQVNGDAKFEPRETYALNLTLPTGGLTIADGAGVAGIANDDADPSLDTDGDGLLDTTDCAPTDAKRPAKGTGVIDLNCDGVNDLLVPVKFAGTSKADKVAGNAGNDILNGAGGNDTLKGNAGNDKIAGGAGNDKLDGGVGNDTVDGGAGNDSIAGGPGNDKLTGAAGNDKINGGAGNDKMSGGPGNDAISAKDGFVDTIVCGSGRDAVTADRKDKVAKDCERVRRI